MASWLAESMTKEGHQVGVLSGEMTVEQRAAVIERYRQGKEKVLVTTNVCSRGEPNWGGWGPRGTAGNPGRGFALGRNRRGTSDPRGEL